MNRAIFIQLFCIIYFFTFLTVQSVHSQGDGDNTIEHCKQLIEKGKKLNAEGKYSEALEYLTKAEIIAEKKHSLHQMFIIKNELGRIYDKMCNYGESLGYYKQVYEIANNNIELKNQVPVSLNNIGILYYRERDYKKALEYFKKAYDFKEKKSAYIKVLIALNIADIYNKKGDFTEAKKFLLEVKDTDKPIGFEQGWIINYAECLLVEGQVDNAEEMLEALYNKIYNEKFNENIFFASHLLSRIYDKQNKGAKAIQYAEIALRHTSILHDKIELYSHLSKLYLKKTDSDKAIQYKDSVIAAKDSLSSIINSGLYESNKVKLKVQEYQNELLTKDEKQQRERILFTGGIIFIIMVSLYVYRWQKNKIIKHRQEKIISENREKIFDLELKDLKNNIAEKNRKLSANALYLSGRNGLIDSTIHALSQIPQVAKNKDVAEYINTLRGYLKTDAEWDDFITYFEQVNPEFLKTLKQKHPDLSPADIRFICYVYMNLDTREIGNIFNITYNASRKRKMRIKEKIGIKDDDSLYEYLLQIVTV
jgi:tetratricopeptide (TPR) repeat protein/DNA-binding CsgD family transcriptional regulator